MLKEAKITLCDLSINYVGKGNGPAMIFLHNGGGFWQSWQHQLNHFSEKYTVYGIDWPGFGESQAPNGLISLTLLTDVLEAFIIAKNLEGVILVGNCIGGSAALNYSNRYPEKVLSLIIFNICPGSLIYPVRLARKIIPAVNHRPFLKSILRWLFVFAFTQTPVRRKFPMILFGRNYNPESELSKRYKEKFKLSSQTTSRVNLVFSVHTFNIEAYMHHRIPKKHLLVWGSDNLVTSLKKHGYYHYDYLKSDEFKIIQHAGHLCMYEKSSETNELIESYLTRTSCI